MGEVLYKLPQKCCVIHCHATGIPSAGFDFFVCCDCCDELERLLEEIGGDGSKSPIAGE